MVEETPNNVGMAIGELKGLVSGLSTMLTQQNVSAASNREELMRYLKNTYDSLQEHIKEDAVINNAVIQLTKWQSDASPKVDTLWDEKNSQRGFLAAVGLVGSIVGGIIVAGVEWLKK